MRGLVPYKGKFVKADNIPRGGPILYSAEEWMAREKAALRRYMRRILVILPATIITVVSVFYLIAGHPFWPDIVASAVAYAIAFPLILTVPEVLNGRKARRAGVYSGLFRNGLMLRVPMTGWATFVPYGSVEDFEIKRVNFVNDMLMLRLCGFKKPQPIYMGGLLDVKGQGMLRTMIMRASTRIEAPDLHVYGGRASRVRSIPTVTEDTGKVPEED